MYRDVRRDGPSSFDVVLLDDAVIDAARAGIGARELVVREPCLTREDPRAGALLALHELMDTPHLVRAFRSAVGIPPYDFLTRARIHRARELLRAGASATEAAAAVGICDQSQLHRHFVRIVGPPPGRYARQRHVYGPIN